MKTPRAVAAAGRLFLGFVAGALIALFALDGWLWCVARLARSLLDAGSWWLERCALACAAHRFEIAAEIDLRMLLQTGQPLPRFPATWSKGVQQAQSIFVVSMALWPLVRKRGAQWIAMLAVAVGGSAIVAAIDLVVEAKYVALHFIGTELLPARSFADTETNVSGFRALAREFSILEWIKAFLDAGGRLFLAACLTLGGEAVRVRMHPSARPTTASGPQATGPDD